MMRKSIKQSEEYSGKTVKEATNVLPFFCIFWYDKKRSIEHEISIAIMKPYYKRSRKGQYELQKVWKYT